jgi:hypothetical protein
MIYPKMRRMMSSIFLYLAVTAKEEEKRSIDLLKYGRRY